MTAPLQALWPFRNGVCWRLVRVESPPLAELVAPGEWPALMAFLEGTVGLGEDPGWADRPFRAPSPEGSRFSDGSFGIFYAGLDLPTCTAEMAYHQARQLRLSGAPGMRLHFATLRARVTGEFLDIRQGHASLHRPNSYLRSRAFGIRAWRAAADGIAYRSVRNPGGECLAGFRRACVLGCAKGGLVAMTWDGTNLAR